MTTITKKPTTVTIRGGKQTVVRLDRATVANINDNRPTIDVTRRDTNVGVQDRRPEVSVGSALGLQGPAGETEGATVNVPAGSTIFGGRVVRVENGQLFHPDPGNDAHAGQVLGIATQSTSIIGTQVLVRTKGTYVEPGASFVDGLLYCGAQGQLVSTPPAAPAWLMVVGRVINATSFDVDIETAFHRV